MSVKNFAKLFLFRPCFGFSLQVTTKLLGLVEGAFNIVLIIFLTLGICTILDEWNKSYGQWIYSFRLFTWIVFYSYYAFNVVFTGYQYAASKGRDADKLTKCFIIAASTYAFWLIVWIIHIVWVHRGQPFITVIDRDRADIMFIIYRKYTLWVLWSFRREILHYGPFNKVIKRLSDDDVTNFIKGTPPSGPLNHYQQELNNLSGVPYNTDFEIPSERLLIKETLLGKGAFGVVLEATLLPDKPPVLVQPESRYPVGVAVAVKTVSEQADPTYFKALLSELKILSYIGHNPNIVNLVGACISGIQQGKLYVVVELCSNGSVLSYLQKHRDQFHDSLVVEQLNMNASASASNICIYVTNCTDRKDDDIITKWDLLKFAIQTCQGMEYISSKKVIHGDLAARNCLLTWDKNVKIADFGLSRQLYHCTSYLKNKNNKAILPWKWMAVEALADFRFSTQTDIWSFGVTLWEYYSCGAVPFLNYQYGQEFVQGLKEGKVKLQQPLYAPNEIYEIIQSCCNVEATKRPSFSNLRHSLERFYSTRMEI